MNTNHLTIVLFAGVILRGILRVSFYAFVIFAILTNLRWTAPGIALTHHHFAVCYGLAFLADMIRMELKK